MQWRKETGLRRSTGTLAPPSCLNTLSVGGNNSRAAFHSQTLIYHPVLLFFINLENPVCLQARDWQTFP